jgi:rRNA processing protein Gar1
MKKLGTVDNVIHDGTMLLSATGADARDIPAQGTSVCDSRGVVVGHVSRVFGPVKEPYITVKPREQTDMLGLIGSALYAGPEEQNRRPRPTREPRRFRREGATRPRSRGPIGKKGVNRWQRKEKPRKK